MIFKNKQGFTLIEMMIVVVLVAVLLTVALPSYQQLRKTRRSLARAELMEVMARQEQFFLDHRQYASELTIGISRGPSSSVTYVTKASFLLPLVPEYVRWSLLG